MRLELVDRLLEHERFKNAAQMLQQKRLIEENVWSNPQIQSYLAEDEDPGLQVTLFDISRSTTNAGVLFSTSLAALLFAFALLLILSYVGRRRRGRG